jgi:hypothetical protein
MTDFELFMRAARASVLDQNTARIIQKVYDALDLTKRQAHTEGFDLAVAAYANDYENGRVAGYQQGFDAKVDVYKRGVAAGYEQARRDLGECPMVDQEFDDWRAESTYDAAFENESWYADNDPQWLGPH